MSKYVCDVTIERAPAETDGERNYSSYRRFRPVDMLDVLKAWQTGTPYCKEQLMVRTADSAGDWLGPAEHECLPDFSCCRPDLLAPQATRDAFVKAYVEERDDVTGDMLSTFLTALMMTEQSGNAHVAGQAPQQQTH